MNLQFRHGRKLFRYHVLANNNGSYNRSQVMKIDFLLPWICINVRRAHLFTIVLRLIDPKRWCTVQNFLRHNLSQFRFRASYSWPMCAVVLLLCVILWLVEMRNGMSTHKTNIMYNMFTTTTKKNRVLHTNIEYIVFISRDDRSRPVKHILGHCAATATMNTIKKHET